MKSPAPLTEALESLLRFGSLTLRAGDAAFRVRESMGLIASSLGIEHLSLHIAVHGMTATARRGDEYVTLASEVGPLGIDASRLGALEHLARQSRPGLTPGRLGADLDAIEAARPLYPVLVVAIAVAAASSAFAWLNGGSLSGLLAAFSAGGFGQALRLLLLHRRTNQYAVTAVSALFAAGLYWLVATLLDRAGLRPDNGVGVVAAVLFLVPGFPLVAALIDLLQRQTLAGIVRLAYGMTLLMAAGFGLGIVVTLAGLTAVTPPPTASGGFALTLLWRALASFIGGCGFAVLYNTSLRTVIAVGGLALIGNGLRLALHDGGLPLASATFVGALAVGLLASIVRPRLHEPRIALTVPGIIIMVPGAYAFQAIVMFGQGQVLEGLQAAVLAGFVVGAMALGLVTARFVSQRKWIFES
ncbi:MAG: threonine/serine exporter ThrE family protein [Reyranellales bacterium]